MQNISVARRRKERSDSAQYSDGSFEDDDQIQSGEEEEGDSEYDSAEHSGSDDLSERESGDGQAAPGSQKEVDHDEDRRNPQYIPKKGTFYEHDDRTALGEEEDKDSEDKESQTKGSSISSDILSIPSSIRDKSSVSGTPSDGKERKSKPSRASAADKWTHDKFNENDQAPKSSEELVSIYGYDIRAEEGPPRAFRRRKYGRGPNKYTRNWEDEKAYSGKSTPIKTNKTPPQVTNGEEFPSLQSSNERNRGDRRRNGHNIPKKTIEVVSPKIQQEVDKNANTTKTSRSTAGDHHSSGTPITKQTESVTVTKQRTPGTGRVGYIPQGPLRRPYTDVKDTSQQSAQKENSTPIQKISVPPSAGLPSASLGGTLEKKIPTVRKPNASSTTGLQVAYTHEKTIPPTQCTSPPTVISSSSQQPQAVALTSSNANNNALSQSNPRASPPQQVTTVQAQLATQPTTEVAAGRGKRYSSIRQRPMPDQYQPVQYITDFQPTPQQAQQTAPQQQLPAAMTGMPHRQTPPPSLQQTQQQLLSQQQLQQLHQKTPPPQQLHLQQVMQQSTQQLHQANPNLIQTSQQLHQSAQQLHQISTPIQQLHQVSPTLHQSSSSVHQTNTPQMLQSNPSLHQTNQPILQSTTALHQPTSSIIQGQQIHQQTTTLHPTSASLHPTNPSIHQASPTIHQASPPIHQSSQAIIPNNPPIHQVSPPLQTQMGRQGSSPTVSAMPMRQVQQVQRTHQQLPIHNMPAPTHIQGSIPQQGLVNPQTYPTQQMLPQPQYMQNNSTGIYTHNIPPQVYQTQQGFPAPPPPLPYHHQPTPPYPNRSVYREPSGITFYSPQEQKGAIAPPPTRRPTNAIPIVPPPSRRDRERLSDAAAVQKDNIDHIVDNMFVPRHQQPRNAAQRPSDTAKTTEPVASQPEVVVEEKSKDGSGDKSSKELNVDLLAAAIIISELPSFSMTEIQQLNMAEDKDVRLTAESLASEINDKLVIDANAESEMHASSDDKLEYLDCQSQVTEEMDETVQASESNITQSSIDETNVTLSAAGADDQAEEVSSEEVSTEVHSIEEIKETIDETSGVQNVPIIDEQNTSVVEAEPTVVEEIKADTPTDVPAVTEAEVKTDTDQESEEKPSVEAAD